VAHEVKNPLSGLNLYAGHLKNKLAERVDPAELRIVDKIVEGIDHLGKTVERVLDFVRPAQLPCSVVDLNQLALQALQLTEDQIAEKRIVKSVDLSPGGLLGSMNEAAIRSVIINLVLNAIQAMPEGGRLRMFTAAVDGQVTLTVGDNGCGMSPEQLANLFEPFYTTKRQGLGLGMPYAKKMIEEHRGAIEVRSTVGEGTEVQIRLPAEV
jgi:signal transduction histidine kinase